MSINIEIKGISRLLNSLDEGKLDRNMRAAMNAMTDELKKEMMVYPPPPPNSKYVRTYNLKKSWRTRVSGATNAWLGVVASSIRYGPYVQERDQQALIHRGRWQTIQDVAEEKTRWIVNFINKAINAWIARM